MKKILLGIILLQSLNAMTQDVRVQAGSGYRTHVEVKYLGFYLPESDDVNLVPNYQSLISKNESENQEALEKLKEEKMLLKKKFIAENPDLQSSDKKTRASFEPVLVVGYNALGNSGTPSDNTIAVNKNNQLVAVVNSSLRYYNASTGVALQGVIGLQNFFSTPQNTPLLSNNLCDPKVIFDPQTEKFILFAQTCEGNSSTSQILLAFSKTADPTQGWYFYAFSGNQSAAIGQNGWFDYPKIGVSAHDVFVTGNIFSDNFNYIESVIFQIDKTKCFAGSSLGSGDASIFSGISNSPFTMVPMTNGQTGSYGNSMYLVSTGQTFSGSRLQVYEINDVVQNNPQISTQLVSIPSAGSPANAVQKGSSVELNTGDNRGQDGFYLNGRIHYVFHSDVGNGYAGVNYSRLKRENSSWVLENNQTIKATGKDYTYPTIASMGWNGNDNSAIIQFNYASNTDYPGMKAVFMNENAVASAPIEIKTGLGYADVISQGGETRWGDYCGMSRVQNATTPTAWCFGAFGATNHTWTNHFAKISTTAWPVGTTQVEAPKTEITVYPNPVVEDIFYMNLDVQLAGTLEVNLLDLNGRNIRRIYKQDVNAGPGKFSFNKAGLAAGTYIIEVSVNQKSIQHEKIVVAK
ncbi:MAG: T9SS type A sorting domain-containing protein [Chitinophagaceae bacterium]|nr:T9SS type A sorting domain-containing protein [Chitinophagaceae bacterium]